MQCRYSIWILQSVDYTKRLVWKDSEINRIKKYSKIKTIFSYLLRLFRNVKTLLQNKQKKDPKMWKLDLNTGNQKIKNKNHLIFELVHDEMMTFFILEKLHIL